MQQRGRAAAALLARFRQLSGNACQRQCLAATSGLDHSAKAATCSGAAASPGEPGCSQQQSQQTPGLVPTPPVASTRWPSSSTFGPPDALIGSSAQIAQLHSYS